MTAGRVRRRWWVLVALLFAALMIALLPMRVALSWAGAEKIGFSARSVRGSIWSAQFDDAAIGAVKLGDLAGGVAPMRLLSGEVALALRQVEGSAAGAASNEPIAAPLSATLHRSIGGGYGVSELEGQSNLGVAIGNLPLGKVGFSRFFAGFDAAGRCQNAGGNVRLSLGAQVGGLNLTRGVNGPVTCGEDGVLRAALRGDSDMEQLDLSLASGGRYRAVFMIETGDDAMLSAALTAAGFRAAAPGSYALTHVGAL